VPGCAPTERSADIQGTLLIPRRKL
jgi:hypothetical protein